MEIVNHTLKCDNIIVDFKSLPQGSVMAAGFPDTIIIHFTAGSNAKSVLPVMKNRGVSAHFVIDKMPGAQIMQYMPLNRRAAHAGESAYTFNGVERKFFNNSSIGIEIDNPGPVTKVGEQYFYYYNASKLTNPLKNDQFLNHAHRNKQTRGMFWATYPEEQLLRVYDMCRAMCKAYPIKYILGHDEISPGRKLDPGPAFPLDDLRQTLFEEKDKMGYLAIENPKKYVLNPQPSVTAPGKKTSQVQAAKPKEIDPNKVEANDVTKVAVEKIAIFENADEQSKKIAEIVKDDRLQVIQTPQEGDWCLVKQFKTLGWVSREFIDADNTDSDTDASVRATSLRLRDLPTTNGSKVITQLPKGTKLHILRVEEQWAYVGVGLLNTGWAKKSCLQVVVDEVEPIDQIQDEEKEQAATDETSNS